MDIRKLQIAGVAKLKVENGQILIVITKLKSEIENLAWKYGEFKILNYISLSFLSQSTVSEMEGFQMF